MRRKRKSIAHWLFLALGLVLLVGSVLATLSLAESYGWPIPEWLRRPVELLAQAKRLLPSDDQLRLLLWLGGIAASVAGAGFSLLVSWHFAEMNLPQRIEELKKSEVRTHLALQPRYLALAREGLGAVPGDIETSRLTLLRKWLSRWSEKERVRVLGASATQLAREASALSRATLATQHQEITARLVRGYQHAFEGDDEQALDEFEAAVKVRADNIVSRDIAAGWARRLKNQQREIDLLEEIIDIAPAARLDIDHARALRRRAELLKRHQRKDELDRARDALESATNLLRPLLAQEEKTELLRVVTLYCEVQCDRRRTGRLDGPNGARTLMRLLRSGVPKLTRPEEPDGEAYGEERAVAVDERVTAIQEEGDRGYDQPSSS
jgi:tetratricopeptide (TPR) repeat protein